MNNFACSIGVFDLKIYRGRKSSNIPERNIVAVLGLNRLVNSQVNIAVGEEPLGPEPIQTFTRNITEAIKEVPGNWMFTMPAAHVGMQAFPK